MGILVETARGQPIAWRWNTIGRLAAGMLCLTGALLIAFAMWFNLPQYWERNDRQQVLVQEAIARAALPVIERDDRPALESMLERLVAEDTDLAAVLIRRQDGVLVAFARAAPVPGEVGALLTTEKAWRKVSLMAASGPWGTIEFLRRDGASSGGFRMEWLLACALAFLLAFGAFYLYLRRALAHLDPAAVIPERVRRAFDVLTQGVIFLDADGRIVLANLAFRRAFAPEADLLTGREAGSFKWLLQANKGVPIWKRVMQSSQPIRDESYRLPGADGVERRIVVHAAPVQDSEGDVRGCLLTFEDLTALDTANAELRTTLEELRASRQQVAEQNAKLQELASRDPMTGCLNRRAFQATAEPALALAHRHGHEVVCVMFDIDHFKSVNDTYGHGVGDKVIQSLADIAKDRVRSTDLLCRYGGEEFCLLLPHTSLEGATAMTEALRAQVENDCGKHFGVPDLQVTASFGVATNRLGAATLESLMELADQALYAAKRGGRNRVEIAKPAA